MHEDAAGGGAVLPGVVEAGPRDRLGDGADVLDVVEHDDRRLAAELQVDPLEVLGRGLRDLHARAHRAGDRDHRRGRVADDPGAGLAVADDDVEHARREDLTHDLGQLDRGDRGGVRRLEHDRVARGQRRGDLPDGHHHRVVPRRDLAHDADRLVADHRGVVGEELTGGRPLQRARGAREEAEVVGRGRDLVLCHARAGLARVEALRLDKLLAACFDGISDLQQVTGTLARRRLPPRLERGDRRGVGCVDVLLAGDRRLEIDLPGARIDHIGELAALGVREFTVDEVLQTGGQR